MSFQRRDGLPVPPALRAFNLTPEVYRVPDRQGGRVFDELDRQRPKLRPVGRKYDIFGDVLVTVSRVRAME